MHLRGTENGDILLTDDTRISIKNGQIVRENADGSVREVLATKVDDKALKDALALAGIEASIPLREDGQPVVLSMIQDGKVKNITLREKRELGGGEAVKL